MDEARDYVVEDLMHVGRVDIAGYVDGVGSCDRTAPRRNLTGDPYYTDGKRAVVVLSESRTHAQVCRPHLIVHDGRGTFASRRASKASQ